MKFVWRSFVLTAMSILGCYCPAASAADTLGEGESLYKAGRYEDAENLFIRLLSKEPRNCSAHYMMGNCLTQLGKANEAKSHYQYVIDREPGSTVAEYCKMAMQNAAMHKGTAASGVRRTGGGGGGLLLAPMSAGAAGGGGAAAMGNQSAPAGTTVFFGHTRSAQFDDNSKILPQAQALGAECDTKVDEMDRDTAARVARLQQDSQDSMVSFSNGKYSYGAAANAYNQPVKREYEARIKAENDANSKAKRELQDNYAKRMRALGGAVNF